MSHTIVLLLLLFCSYKKNLQNKFSWTCSKMFLIMKIVILSYIIVLLLLLVRQSLCRMLGTSPARCCMRKRSNSWVHRAEGWAEDSSNITTNTIPPNHSLRNSMHLEYVNHAVRTGVQVYGLCTCQRTGLGLVVWVYPELPADRSWLGVV